MSDIGVLLPLRIETRFKGGDLWIRVIPDEPWFVREDSRITEDELGALRRYAAAPSDPGADGIPPAWHDLAGQVGAPRAVDLHRRFITTEPDGRLLVRPPAAAEVRNEPALPRVEGFPSELAVWVGDAAGGVREVLRLTVDRSRLLVDFADPDVPGDRRWWEDWEEAVAVGVAGVVPAAEIAGPIEALYVTGLGEGDPADLFAGLVAEGRVGLLAPGTPTNSLEGAPAASPANDAATWWGLLQSPPGDADADVSGALTGDPMRLGNMPGGERPHRQPRAALVTAMWPALWGFAAGQVFDVARGPAPARWATGALFPEGAYPTVRVGPQPYALLPTTSWSSWAAADGDPSFEPALVRALLRLREGHVRGARARGTVTGKTTEELLDILADTPTSSRFRYRPAWPLELWWLAMTGSGLPVRWRSLVESWSTRYPLAGALRLGPLRRYGARGPARRIGVPLVLPPGVDPADLGNLLNMLAEAAFTRPAAFADTEELESDVLGLRGDSLLIRLAIRSLQLVLADLRRERDRVTSFDPEPFSRNSRQRGRLEQLIASVTPADATEPTETRGHLVEITTALRSLGAVPVPELERMLAATIDCANHRIDAWFLAAPQRRFDEMHQSGTARRRLGAYGWVDGPAPGNPGPTEGGLLHAPSASAALAAAVLRDRAVSDSDGRWDLDVTSRKARVANRLAEHVRAGAHLADALGREVERVVGRTAEIEQLRRDFPVRTEHAGRRVCDGLRILALPSFPVAVDAAQEAALQELRDGLDAYADLLVADAVHHLVEGRPEVAGATMDGAAGLSRPPELSLLRTPREGRAVSSSVVLALSHVADTPLPAPDSERALVSPVATLDPSVAAWLAAEAGQASDWHFEVRLETGAGEATRTVTLADLDLEPAAAPALTRTQLERLAVELAAEREGVDLDAPEASGAVVGGSGTGRYERAADLIGLVGRDPAGPRALSEDVAGDPVGEGVDASLLTRYVAAREIGAALAGQLRAQVRLLGADGGIGGADPVVLRRLLRACARWGIAPDPPRRGPDPLLRLADAARQASAQLEDRLATAPDAVVAGELARGDFLAAAAGLVSPTGQVGLTGTWRAGDLPVVQRGDGDGGLDGTWLTVVAAVRPSLARLEAHQLRASTPFSPWTNRADDPWQADASDARRLVVVYATAGLDLATLPAEASVAVTTVDRFSEVIPAPEQFAGAAFGFDAPAARAQQAILLAVPPDVTKPLDHETLALMLADTRELAHARMARPVDLDDEFWALAPTALLPASGRTATPLEVRRP